METTRDLILTSALKVFSRKGYRNSSIKDIADKAEINSLTIFRYFHDKNELFQSTIQMAREHKFDPSPLDHRLSYKDIAADLNIMSEYYIDEIYANIALMRIYISETQNFDELKTCSWFICPWLKEHFISYVSKLKNVSPAALDNSDLLAEMLISYLTKLAMSTTKFKNEAAKDPARVDSFHKEVLPRIQCMTAILTSDFSTQSSI